MWASYSCLYAAYAIFSITDRVWVYVLIFILQGLGGLTVIGYHQMLQNAACVLMGPVVGQQLDRLSRRRGALITVFIKSISVTITSILLILCSQYSNNGDMKRQIILGVVIVCSSIYRVASEGVHLVIAKDWIVVMAESEEKTESGLAVRNAFMTTIYHVSSVCAPALGGFLVDSLGHKWVCFIYIGWSTAVLVTISVLLVTVHSRVTELSEKQSLNEMLSEDKPESVFSIYMSQTIFPACLGLAMVSVTVLEFDSLVIGYAHHKGLSPQIIGFFGSASAGFGLMGSLLYTVIERCMLAKHAGFVGVILFVLSITPCIVSLFLPGGVLSSQQSLAAVYAYLGGVCLDRIGIWIMVMAVTQILQETVPDSSRSAVFGLNSALGSFFVVIKDLIIIYAPGPDTFSSMIFASFGIAMFTLFSYVFYLFWDNKKSKVHFIPQISAFHAHVS
ncbi:hypothetical protein QR680_015373 [Steinernema hermaphroditum]|uniref:Solute carrier family 40 member n=1 Tax=Steinernema hermaphroditum TaxID=289476 RepID=A0AA39H7G3_9BILA|nr:hypothetical protein QR680_015373 [Steinernema hermaphroditum]